jgi:pimeloyl-ACP methyl ester carboxylesterase
MSGWAHACWLGTFDRPSRVVWGSRDRHLTLALGHRLAAALPRAELVEVDDATTLVSIDRPHAVTEVISAVVDEVCRAAGRARPPR